MDIHFVHKFLVRTHCATYNHENYITDALKGFVMQETTFPVVYTIIDDASTDRTADVIRQFVNENFDLNTSSGYEREMEYGHVTFARHKNNTNCWFAVIYLKENHYSQKKSKAPYLKEWENTKYIALCEGDDYWTDPLKLQKQVDFLEEHKECAMCFHGAFIYNEAGLDVGLSCQELGNHYYSATELFEKWIVPTASIVCHKEIQLYPIKNPKNVLNGDIFLVEKCAHCGSVYGMKERMSVYRIHQHGVTYDISLKEERVRRYPAHFREIKRDFPLINRSVIDEKIGISYFEKGSYEKCFVLKCYYYIIGTLYYPRLMVVKLGRLFNKK